MHGGGDRVAQLDPVTDAQEVAAMIEACRAIHVAEPLRRYIVELVRATRHHAAVELGRRRAPRWRCCARRARSRRGASGYATPDDVKRLRPAGARPPADHRRGHRRRSAQPESVLDELLLSVPIPEAR